MTTPAYTTRCDAPGEVDAVIFHDELRELEDEGRLRLHPPGPRLPLPTPNMLRRTLDLPDELVGKLPLGWKQKLAFSVALAPLAAADAPLWSIFLVALGVGVGNALNMRMFNEPDLGNRVKLLNQALGSRIELVGDDLFVTNPQRGGMLAGAADAVSTALEVGTVASSNRELREVAGVKHGEAGGVAMARSSAPDSASSQFYITLAPTPFLDMNYAVFGRDRKSVV